MPLIGDTRRLGNLYGSVEHTCEEICRVKWPKWAGTISEEEAFVEGLQQKKQVVVREEIIEEEMYEIRSLSPSQGPSPSPSSYGNLEGVGILAESIPPQTPMERHWALSHSPSR